MNSPESKSMMVAKAVVKKDSAKLLSPVDLKRLLEHKAPLSERRPKTAPSETKQRFSTPEGTRRRKRKKMAGSPSSVAPNQLLTGNKTIQIQDATKQGLGAVNLLPRRCTLEQAINSRVTK